MYYKDENGSSTNQSKVKENFYGWEQVSRPIECVLSIHNCF